MNRFVLAATLLVAAAFAQSPAKLGHPTVEERIESLGVDPNDGFRFVVFGDQKNLWKRDFPKLLEQVKELAGHAGEPPLLCLVDTGDIVNHGPNASEFEELRQLLAAVPELPYLVAVGNHELRPKQPKTDGREHTVSFLAGMAPEFSVDLMYFAKTIGPVRFLFLNSNDFPGIYENPGIEGRRKAQMEWLRAQLETITYPTIVFLHHPFIQSASKHRAHATAIWNYEYDDGRTLPEMLVDGGVYLVVSGHIHSYEVFRLRRNEKEMWSLNASGKPKGFTAGPRRPKDWGGKEMRELEKTGFRTRLREWEITQEDYLRRDEEANQYGVIQVDREGNLDIEVRSVDAATPLHTMRIEVSSARR